MEGVKRGNTLIPTD